MKVLGSGAIPLNSAEEKSNPGFYAKEFSFSIEIKSLPLLEISPIAASFGLPPSKKHLIDYVLWKQSSKLLPMIANLTEKFEYW